MPDLENIFFFYGWTNFCRIDKLHLEIETEPADVSNLGTISSEFMYLKP